MVRGHCLCLWSGCWPFEWLLVLNVVASSAWIAACRGEGVWLSHPCEKRRQHMDLCALASHLET